MKCCKYNITSSLNIMYFFRHSLGEEYPVQITIVGCAAILEGMINSILTQKDIRKPAANLIFIYQIVYIIVNLKY